MRFEKYAEEPPPPAIGRGELRRRFEEWEPEHLFALHRRRVQRYLPIWFAVYPLVAEAAGLTEDKRKLHRLRMTELIERVDAFRAGERVIKARLKETESAISAVTHPNQGRMLTKPWSIRARTAALTARSHIHFIADPPSSYPVVMAGAVYRWAEVEAGFPEDSALLLTRLSPEEMGPAPDGDLYGNRHLVYGRPAEEAGLGEQGRRVYAEVARIMENVDAELEPFVVDSSFWQGNPRPAGAVVGPIT